MCRRKRFEKVLSFLNKKVHSQILTLDSVTVSVDAAIYYKVTNATASVVSVENVHYSTCLIAQTTLRNVVGKVLYFKAFVLAVLLRNTLLIGHSL